MSQANHRLVTDPDYLADVNRVLADEGLTYHGTTTVKHFVWILLEDVGEAKTAGIREAPVDGVARGPVLRMLPATTQRGAGL